ncbi:MAG: acetyl-CoA C-acyltransferase [Gammaproteobacteria bacterium]|nr:acetyl-CoA C-acyltransferase [Gammaproteobacteria bacterium]
MNKQTQDAYVVNALRTPVGKASRGMFATTRPDDLLAHVIRGLLARYPQLDKRLIGDVIVGCAMPEAEQGMNVARIALLLAGLPDSVPGVTVNRFCASGLQAVAMAADRIRLGEADIMLAAGTESMSLIPMMGNKIAFNPRLFAGDSDVGIAYGMGTTAEKVAVRWKISREAQDEFALESHKRALAAIGTGEFSDEILPYEVTRALPDMAQGVVSIQRREVDIDEGPRADSTIEGLAALRPLFAVHGSVTAGNSSQMSDGAAAVLLASQRGLKMLETSPVARFLGYAVAGVAPEVMGIGPIEAIPKALKLTGINQNALDWIELNEAFAAQSLAVIGELDLDRAKVNPLGGAIALGHPLGATGAIRTATLIHGLKRHGLKYGMVTMCVGTGMGAAGVFEAIM